MESPVAPTFAASRPTDVMEYKIRKTAGTCGGCSQEIPLDTEMVSTILLESIEPSRRDFCIACFERLDRKPEDEFAYWRTKRTGTKQVRRVIDFPTLRALFYRMAQQAGEEYRKIGYLVALLLLRKKYLRLHEFVTEGGKDYVVVSSKEKPDALKIEAPSLRAEEFAEIREKLSCLLDVDIEADGGLEAPTSDVESSAVTDAG